MTIKTVCELLITYQHRGILYHINHARNTSQFFFTMTMNKLKQTCNNEKILQYNVYNQRYITLDLQQRQQDNYTTFIISISHSLYTLLV